MVGLAALQPGFLGVESVRDPATGLGITVSYWTVEDGPGTAGFISRRGRSR
jgi:heme-degrading monooxygenase HmoA